MKLFKCKILLVLGVCVLGLIYLHHHTPATQSTRRTAQNLHIHTHRPLHNTTKPRDVRHVCQGRHVTLLVCVACRRGDVAARSAIRDTWGSPQDGGAATALVFFVGFAPRTEPAHVEGELREESAVHGDISHGNYTDSYQNLSTKSLAILDFALHLCSQATYLLKADADTYVNLTLLLDHLTDTSQSLSGGEDGGGGGGTPPFLLGYKHENVTPVREPGQKYYVSRRYYNKNIYPVYLNGGDYAMTITAAREILRVAPLVAGFVLEDVYVTGMCAQRAGLRRVDDRMFRHLGPGNEGWGKEGGRRVFHTWVSGIDISPADMRRIHTET